MSGPWEKYSAQPSMAPVRVGAPDPMKVRDQQLQEEANRRAEQQAQLSQERFSYQQQRDAQQDAKINQKQIPTPAAAGIQANMETLRSLDAAIAALEKRPQSIGPGTGMLGDTFTQINDPDGTDVRSRVGKVGAYTIHDLSGAAVSATEAPRFSAFVPRVDDTPDKALKNLKLFREAMQAQIKESLDYYSEANGYQPYSTPQAQQFLQGDAPPPTARRLTPEQQDEFFGILNTQGKDAAMAYLGKFGLNPKDPSALDKPHSEGIDYSAADAQAQARVQQKVDELNQGGTTGIDALNVGAKDALTLGFSDEIAAAGDAFRGSMSGQGSFGDLYNTNVAANRQFQNELQGEHPYFYGGGQLVGGALLPVGGASSAGQLARMGALYGGAYGAGSGEGLDGRAANALLGAGTGAALGYAIPKGIGLIPRRAAKEVPPLVSESGRLNEPLEAMRPGERVAQAREFGIDLPLGSATDRGGAIIEKGLDNLPGSAGVMNDARRATEGQVQTAVDNVADKFGSSRTLNEGGSEAQRGAKEWMTRFDAVTSKAYDAIPISPKAPTNLNNTKATLEHLAGKLESNPELAEEIKDPTLLRYLDAINKHGLSWQDLKDFRTFVGNKIGQFRFSEDARTGDYRSLYAALSEDMRASANAQGPQALRAFERANAMKAEGERRIEGALKRILGPDAQAAPEKAAMAIQAMTKGGKATGDLKTLTQVRAATIKSGAWDEIASTLIRMGGQPANSPGRGFDPKVFVQWYADMAEPARAMLFKPELRKTLDQFVAVNQRIAGSNALRNTSQTIPNMTGTAFAGGAGAALMMGHLGTLVAIGGEMAANYGMAKLWTSPKFVQWATGYSRAMSSSNANAVSSQVGRLSKMAAVNPELRAPIESLLRHIANDNAVAPIAASPDANGQNQNQQ